MDTLLRQVQQTLQAFRMLERHHTVLVAVSGGPDSMAMLQALYRLREAWQLTLIVAHLNHQMRPDAAEDARFVAAAAAALGLPYVGESIDVPAYRSRFKLSPEDAARRVRYAFLGATAARLGADRIAIGHTADDQAETVLLRLLRGAGLTGLAGMPPVRGRIIRPLIQVRRSAVLAFLQAHRIPFREDPSNRQRRYSRNRLRLELLPLLQQHGNPRLVETLSTTAMLLAADDAALQAIARERLTAMRLPAPAGHVCLSVDGLAGQPPALQRRILREALREIDGDWQGARQSHIAAILRLLATRGGTKGLSLPRRLVVERRYDVLVMRPAEVAVAAVEPRPLPIPGQCVIDELGVSMASQRLARGPTPAAWPSGDVVWLDAAAVGDALWVRTRRPGDRFQPLGCPHPRKLKAFLIDAKIPRPLRDRLVLVEAPRGIAWVAGVQLADWAKVTAATRDIVQLQVLRRGAGAAAAGDQSLAAADFPVVFRGAV
jgi:tRNA(Ile)-lysidine synthase